MDLTINIALLALGSIGAIVAIVGDTWVKGPEQVINRITRRGWVSIALLVVTLTLGVTKEIRSSIASEVAAIKAAAETAELQLKLEKANTELRKLRQDVSVENAFNDTTQNLMQLSTSINTYMGSLNQSIVAFTELREDDYEKRVQLMESIVDDARQLSEELEALIKY